MPGQMPIRTVETHAEGMPMRVVVGGTPEPQGETMAERRAWLAANLDGVRGMLMNEPRGHAAMVGSIIMQPARNDADFGVVFMSGGGFWAMCGHGTIGVVTAIVETGLVAVTEPYTEVRLDTAAGLVVAKVHVKDGKALSVTFTNVPSYVLVPRARVEVRGVGPVDVSIVYGGNLYVVADAAQFGTALEIANLEDLTNFGLALVANAREQVQINHPPGTDIGPLRSAIFTEPAGAGRRARNLMVKEPRYFDRSPCGTGTSARMAMAHHFGELALDEPFPHESIIGTVFEGRLIGQTDVGGVPAVIPQITGRAWITGKSEFLLDPSDVFPMGFKFL
jgi:proline racemase